MQKMNEIDTEPVNLETFSLTTDQNIKSAFF